MNRFYTSDWHLGHVNMTRAGRDLCGRPFDTVDEMNTAIIELANETCAPDDELYILGDIAMGKLDESLPLLGLVHCKLILLPGNHDRFSLAYQRKGDRTAKVFEQAMRYADAAKNASVKLETLGQPSEFEAPINTGTGRPIVMSHYPYQGDSHGEDRHADMRPTDRGNPIIHGHVHTEWKFNGRQFNVGVDVNDFKPVSEEEVLEWYSTL